jgi:UDP-2-acetamido-3-amino-2,3-dideoxy-glucuronate N-acetyltransferase
VVTALVQASADVADDAQLGDGTSVWHLAQVRERAVLGTNCSVGRGAYVGTGVRLGDNCKLQNYALIYEPAVLEDGVFIGPGVVFTNDRHPRSVSPDGRLKVGGDWTAVGVTVRHGASIGARAVCVAPVTIGRWAMVAAGAVVTKDVANYALVAGAPARQIRWVGRAGVQLTDVGADVWLCPQTGQRYVESRDGLTEAVDHE